MEMLPLAASPARDCSGGTNDISSGFVLPRHTEGYLSVDLNRELVSHPESTFFARVEGSAMSDAGVDEGDILLVDKSLDVVEGDMAVCVVNGEFLVRYVHFDGQKIVLMSANPNSSSLSIGEDDDFSVWGVVTYTIRKMRNCSSINGEK